MEIIKNRRGQAEIFDGLILLLITAICSVALISISGNYGSDAARKYDATYAQKLSQNALLSLYHITWERKSLMAHVSQEVAKNPGDPEIVGTAAGDNIEQVLEKYSEYMHWKFGFSILDSAQKATEDTYITTDPDVDFNKFGTFPKNCANAALTYPESGGMDYVIFQVCAWLP